MIGDVAKFKEEDFEFVKAFVEVMIEDEKIGRHSMVNELDDCIDFLFYDLGNKKAFLFNWYKEDFDKSRLPNVLNGIVERLCDGDNS